MGGIEGGAKCVKILLFIFNLIFFLVGLLLVIAGALIQTKFNEYVTVLGSSFSVAPFIIIGVGSFILVVAFFGCCGAFKEHVCMVQTFAAFLIIILIVEFAGAIAGFVLQSKILPIITKALTQALGAYNKNNAYKVAIDKIQQEFSCCGVNSTSDWNGQIPPSCCAGNVTTCPQAKAFTQGCLAGFQGFVNKNIGIVAGIAMGVCFIEILGIVFACCLASSIKNNYEAV